MAATRFPGKPLADICGRPMVQWVYERALRAKGVSGALIATCDREIADAVRAFGGQVAMTSGAHRSGTDRVAEAAADLDADVIVNLQGDEPLIDPASIDRALEPFAQSHDVVMTSLMVPIDHHAAADENLVKVVVDLENWALYFSRRPIPFFRAATSASPPSGDEGTAVIFGHVGLYAYTRDFLLTFASLPPTPLEQAESLEQLRALEHGYRIKMVQVSKRPLGVDTPEDLERVRRAIRLLQRSSDS